MAQAITCGLLIAESPVQYQVNVYGGNIGPESLLPLPNICAFSCCYYATGAAFLFIYLPPTLYNFTVFNLSKPTGHVMHHQFNIQQL
jgi:hypothetical protein